MIDNNDFDKELDYEPDLITLEDEDGKEHEFEILDKIETEEDCYFALVPYSQNAEESLQLDNELILLKVMDEDGEEYLGAIEDEKEFDQVAAMFMERLSDLYDIEQ